MQRNPFRIATLCSGVLVISLTALVLVPDAQADQQPDAGWQTAAEQSDTDIVVQVSDGASEQVWTANGTGAQHDGQLDTRSHFRIGSVTKTFVATVVLQLVDAGRIALDGSIADQLPGVAIPDGQRITVRQLLGHTSGLYDYMKEPGMSTNRWRGADRFTGHQPRELLEVAFRHPPYFPPGTGFRYSNTNYIVLGLLIEQVTGNRYRDEIARRILAPLGLADTVLPGNEGGIPAPAITAHRKLPDGTTVDVTEMDPSLDWAAGEMISTTADLTVFLDALLSERLISRAALDEMKQTVPMGMGFHYGLGLQRLDSPCGGPPLWGHGGELLGYLTYAYRAADGRTVSIVIASAESSNPIVESTVRAAICPDAVQ